jgi:hypothetical protein
VYREGDPKVWSTVLVTVLGSLAKLVPCGHKLQDRWLSGSSDGHVSSNTEGNKEGVVTHPWLGRHRLTTPS